MAGRAQVPTSGLHRALVALCLTEITSWGALYYSLPVASASIGVTTGWSGGTIAAAFSAGLLLSAGAGVLVGRLLDRVGPRLVMTAGSIVGVTGLVLVAAARSLPAFVAAWLVVGLGQSACLYPPAFTAVTRWYGDARTWPLTILTLVGGLASTVFAPLTAALIGQLGWRGTYLVLAAILAAVTIPLHALFLTPTWPAPSSPEPGQAPRSVRSVSRGRAFVRLQASMTLTALGLYAVTINLIPLLTGRGLAHGVAAVAFGLVGAGQVLGRIVFATVPSGTRPATRTTVIAVAATAALGVLAVLPGPAAALVAVAVLAGAIRGAYTLLQATAVADRWGTEGFGALNGAFVAPITAATALAPAAGALLSDRLGGYAASTAVFAALTAAGVVLARRT